MVSNDYLSFLVKEIHSSIFATVDQENRPHTCAVNLMLCDEGGIYFLTSKGKPFYERLKANNHISLTGMRGESTLSTVALSIRGKAREIGSSLIEHIFEENTYMEAIYPNIESRAILTVFQIYQGEGEFFDLRKQPPFRERFNFGGADESTSGYRINQQCTACGKCLTICPSKCIENLAGFRIREEHCIQCGNCKSICPFDAVTRM